MTLFTPHQDAALNAVAAWLKSKPGRNGVPQVFRLFGYAGTGKTTLARHLAEAVDGKVLFAAFTGKAALVMRSKGCERATHRGAPPKAGSATVAPHARHPRGGLFPVVEA